MRQGSPHLAKNHGQILANQARFVRLGGGLHAFLDVFLRNAIGRRRSLGSPSFDPSLDLPGIDEQFAFRLLAEPLPHSRYDRR